MTVNDMMEIAWHHTVSQRNSDVEEIMEENKMRVKEGFILHNIGDEYMAVATGDAAQDFNGIVRSNETAAYIFELLQEETTEEAVVDAMCEKYDAPRAIIEKDVAKIVGQMREAGFLDE